MPSSFTSDPIPLPVAARDGRFSRADLVLEGVEQAGPSFDGLVFVNNPDADRDTERSAASGYAGAFHVYGQGPASGGLDDDAAVTAPITKRVIATDAVRLAAGRAGEITVTVVPVPRGAGTPRALLLHRVSLVIR